MYDNLYSATYSGVAVYEFIHPKSSVMRRKKDGWVNATHILKVANFPKAKRTRILEKDVQTGIHEKVQGGYGKYQGTWVPLQRAKEIANLFGVLNELIPVFDYQSTGTQTPPPAPKHHHASNSNSAKKKLANNSNIVNKPKKPKTIPKNSTTGTNNKKRSLNNNSNNTAVSNKRILKAPKLNKKSSIQSESQKSFQNQPILNPNNINININNNSNNNTNNSNLIHDLDDDDLDDDLDDDDLNNNSNNNSMKRNSSLGLNITSNKNSIKLNESIYNRLHEPSTVEFMSENDIDKALEQSETYGNPSTKNIKISNISNVPISSSSNNSISHSNLKFQTSLTTPLSLSSNSNSKIISNQLDKSYAKELYNYFTELDYNSNCEMPDFIINLNSNFNINQPIDNLGNTTLHWACAMGAYEMCKLLVLKNCNIHLLNNQGEEPIFKTVNYENCFKKKKSFPKLLNLLIDSLLIVDLNGRTLLHHIAISSNNKDNLPASRYYTEILLRKIAETVKSNDKFNDYLNKQDINGNTAFHIFTFNNAKKCIEILLGYNAKIDIRNKMNDTVSDYLTDNFKNQHNNMGLIQFDALSSQIDQQPTFAYESFNLKPFIPNNSLNSYYYSFNNNLINNSNNSNISNNSDIPFKIDNDFNRNSITSSRIGSIKLKLDDQLFELSKSMDNEINQKNDDLKELNLIVEQMNNDINKTTNEFNQVLKNFGSDYNKVETNFNELFNEYNEKCNTLKKLIDRSQAMDLAKIVKTNEDEFLYNKNCTLETNLSKFTLLKLIDLSKLQILRKQTVNNLINILSKSNEFEEPEIINNYRRLVAKLSNMPINEVDSSLNNIEECLKKDNEISTLTTENASELIPTSISMKSVINPTINIITTNETTNNQEHKETAV